MPLSVVTGANGSAGGGLTGSNGSLTGGIGGGAAGGAALGAGAGGEFERRGERIVGVVQIPRITRRRNEFGTWAVPHRVPSSRPRFNRGTVKSIIANRFDVVTLDGTVDEGLAVREDRAGPPERGRDRVRRRRAP